MKTILNMVKSVGDNRLTLVDLIHIFRGTKGSKKVVKYDNLPGAGSGAKLDRLDAERIVHNMVINGYLTEIHTGIDVAK